MTRPILPLSSFAKRVLDTPLIDTEALLWLPLADEILPDRSLVPKRLMYSMRYSRPDRLQSPAAFPGFL